jgi:hypothetical protein
MGRREELAMREWQEIISREHIREHIRVASRELPWEKRPVTVNPNGVAATCVETVATTPLGLLPNFVAIPG